MYGSILRTIMFYNLENISPCAPFNKLCRQNNTLCAFHANCLVIRITNEAVVTNTHSLWFRAIIRKYCIPHYSPVLLYMKV